MKITINHILIGLTITSLIFPIFLFPIFTANSEINESPILDHWIIGNKNSTDAQVCQYWNNHKWVTIYGLDDCVNTTDAIEHYESIGITNVPTVAYLYGNSPNNVISNINGNYDLIISTDSELALHFPHNWNTELNVNYKDALTLANEALNFEQQITIASKYSSNVISASYPGDQATLARILSMWQIDGIRISGSASNINSSFIGAYYNNLPNNPLDLMNVNRQINIDENYTWSQFMNIINETQNINGVLFLYGHVDNPIAIPDFIRYLNNLNQWKANQGELASYIFGEHSLNISGNNGIYQISKPDPTKYGYWNVPITIAIDVKNTLPIDILINGISIKNDLINSNIMQTGYSINETNGYLYISEYWNETSTVQLIT